jgi:hypothetical protein
VPQGAGMGHALKILKCTVYIYRAYISSKKLAAFHAANISLYLLWNIFERAT